MKRLPKKTPLAGARGLLVLIVLMFAQTPCRAGLVLSVQASSSQPGQAGELLVVLENVDDGASTAVRVGAFEFALSLGSQAGIRFTAADRVTGLGADYIFDPAGPGDLSSSTFPGPDIFASDSAVFMTDGCRELAVGEVVGLGHISYEIDGGVASGTLFRVSVDPALTDLSDPDGNLIVSTIRDGTIAVGTAAVPEPSALILLAGGLGLAGACGLRRTNVCRT